MLYSFFLSQLRASWAPSVTHTWITYLVNFSSLSPARTTALPTVDAAFTPMRQPLSSSPRTSNEIALLHPLLRAYVAVFYCRLMCSAVSSPEIWHTSNERGAVYR